jgi:hypothetical protein
MAARLPTSSSERRALIALVVVLGAGAGLRVLLLVAWRPAFGGYPDELVYLRGMWGDVLFADAMRPAGYSIRLRLVDELSSKPTVPILAQHMLGLASGLLLYCSVVRLGFSRWIAVVPVAVACLAGGALFLEHSFLTESLFMFLIAVSSYAAVRALDSPWPGWALATGAVLGAAATVKVVGIVVLPIVALWLIVCIPGGWRRRIVHGGVLVAAAVSVLGIYVHEHRAAIGYGDLTRSGSWNIYGRIAQFADCDKISVPAGAQKLCEDTPPEDRKMNVESYTFDAHSPAVAAFGDPHVAPREANEIVASFSRAVILGQPLEYLRAVAAGMTNYIVTGKASWQQPGPGWEHFFQDILFRPQELEGLRYYSNGYITGYYRNQPALDAANRWERLTRLQGPGMWLALILSLVAPIVTRGRARVGALLFTMTAWALLIAPVAAHWWSARDTVPAGPVLAASAAIGAGALVTRRRERHTCSAAMAR